jgi:hypothetical protein
VIWIDSSGPIKQSLTRHADGVEKRPAPLEDPGQVKPYGFGQQQDGGYEENNLEPAIERHQNFSGRSKAYTR